MNKEKDIFRVVSYSFTQGGLRDVMEKIKSECEVNSYMLQKVVVFQSDNTLLEEGKFYFKAFIDVVGEEDCNKAVRYLSYVRAPLFGDIEVKVLNKENNIYIPYRVFNCDIHAGGICVTTVDNVSYSRAKE